MAELKMLVGLLFALSLRSSSVEPITSVAAAQDASLKMPAAAVLLNKLVLTASDSASALVTAATAACITDSLNLAAALPRQGRSGHCFRAHRRRARGSDRLLRRAAGPRCRAVVRGRAETTRPSMCRPPATGCPPPTTMGRRACSHEAGASRYYRCERRRGEERRRHNQPRAGSVCGDGAVLTAMVGAGKASAGEVGAC